MKAFLITALAGGLLAAPAFAQNPGGAEGVLNGLLSGNRNQDKAVRDAYERGYQKGREDEARLDRNRRPDSRPHNDRGPDEDRRPYPPPRPDPGNNGYPR